jgi:hypothetical protein
MVSTGFDVLRAEPRYEEDSQPAGVFMDICRSGRGVSRLAVDTKVF